jgi:hypothetical protein
VNNLECSMDVKGTSDNAHEVITNEKLITKQCKYIKWKRNYMGTMF